MEAIAELLYISVQTVGHHRSHIMGMFQMKKAAVRKGYTST
jgi:DNA-binding CsgD family transcriptional regulator